MKALNQKNKHINDFKKSNMVGDLVWLALLLGWIILLVIPSAREIFIKVTELHPYWGGFVKFAILASMGDLMGARVLNGQWRIPSNLFQKALVWGIIGMMVTVVFSVYMGGVAFAQSIGRLPFKGSALAQAFFGSTIMNLTFGPMMYVYHMYGDKVMDALFAKKKLSLRDMVETTDWYTLVSFSWLKTCLFVWIPCHTIVFLMPSEYRVLASAFLSILLGLIIAYSKKGSINLKPGEQILN